MKHDRLFSFKRHDEASELCRLEKLASAARLGTVYLGGDTKGDATPVEARITELCSRTLEDCHVHV